jgi:hypothetical protein
MEKTERVLKYVCMALPYGLNCKCKTLSDEVYKIVDVDLGDYPNSVIVRLKTRRGGFINAPIEEIELLLRSMEDMTDEEMNEFTKLKRMSVTLVIPKGASILTPQYIVDLEDDGDGLNYLYEWLLKKHYDFMKLKQYDKG